jgi:3-oxoacyl-[acyl-carrier protein] reductase
MAGGERGNGMFERGAGKLRQAGDQGTPGGADDRGGRGPMRGRGALQRRTRPATALLPRRGRRALALPIDLASANETADAVGRSVEALGRLDVLVNAAGTDAPGTVEELDVEGWDRTLSVNLRAPFLLSKAAFPHMREAGGGIIVNISSVAGKKGWANASAYCASKFGLTGFTEALADEGKGYGIRAIVLYPGAMATNWGVFSPEARQEGKPNEAPPTRALPPERVADMIAWLVASPSEFVLTEAIVLPIEEGLP